VYDLTSGPSPRSVVANMVGLGKTLQTPFTPHSHWHCLLSFPHICKSQATAYLVSGTSTRFTIYINLQHPTSCPIRRCIIVANMMGMGKTVRIPSTSHGRCPCSPGRPTRRNSPTNAHVVGGTSTLFTVYTASGTRQRNTVAANLVSKD
jgi:hypothetical protein